MPISIDRFDEYDSLERRETNGERVIRFLVENRDKAFKASEIAAETDVNQNSIQPVLIRLREKELVRHKEPYWTLGEFERVREAYMFQSISAFLDEKLGEEDRDEWLAAAEVDDEESE